MQERQIHRIFEASILLKGANAVVECLGGIGLAVLSTNAITGLINRVTQGELIEDPHEFVATHLRIWGQHFSVDTKRFVAFYLIAHGVVKLFLVIGLLKGKLWSYPISAVALGLFILYQLYRFSDTHVIGLILLAGFDALVVALIWHEYGVVKRTPRAHGKSGTPEQSGIARPPSLTS